MLIIGNGTLLTNDATFPVVPDGAVAIAGGAIAGVGADVVLRGRHPGHEYIDAQGGLIMPGLVNVHHHFYSAFARGMLVAKPRASVNFMQILENLWWRLDEALGLDDIRLSAAVSVADSIRSGVTTIVDHHAGFGAIPGSLSEIAKAARELGARACLCYETSDRLGEAKTEQSIAENRRFLDSVKNDASGMTAGLFGLHASFTLSDKTLRAAKDAAGDAGFHVHAAEGADDVKDSLARCGKRAVERLNDFGILGKRTLAAHCIHVSPAEMKILADTGTTVLHNPQSNMSNAVGASPLLALLRHGVRVGVGTDGYTHDVLESAKAAGLLQRHHLNDPSVAWAEPCDILLRNNPAIAGPMFKRRLGVLAPGAAADVIVVDYDPPTPVRAENIAGHVHFGLYGPMVRTSVIDGKVAMRDRVLMNVDEKALRAECRERAAKLWKKL